MIWGNLEIFLIIVIVIKMQQNVVFIYQYDLKYY